MFENLFKHKHDDSNDEKYNEYPCKDYLHNALKLIEKGRSNDAYSEIMHALNKAGDAPTSYENIVNQMITDEQYYAKKVGALKVIEAFLNSIQTYDKFGYDGQFLMRLNNETSNIYVSYIHLDDVVSCMMAIKDQIKSDSFWK